MRHQVLISFAKIEDGRGIKEDFLMVKAYINDEYRKIEETNILKEKGWCL